MLIAVQRDEEEVASFNKHRMSKDAPCRGDVGQVVQELFLVGFLVGLLGGGSTKEEDNVADDDDDAVGTILMKKAISDFRRICSLCRVLGG